MKGNYSIREIKGIGDKTEALFNKLSVFTAEDLLRFYPRTYVRYEEAVTDRAAVVPGRKQAFLVTVRKRPVKRSGRIAVTVLRTETKGGIPFEFVWFRLPYLSSVLKSGETFVFYGTVRAGGESEDGTDFFRMEQPEIFTPEKYAAAQKGLQPVYQLTKGLSNNLVRKTLQEVLSDTSLTGSCDYLPVDCLRKNSLPPLQEALSDIHFPESEEKLKKAVGRIAYDEFFFFFLNLALSEKKKEKALNHHKPESLSLYEKAKKNLPFELTEGQEAALSDIIGDMKEEYSCERLIQGDVGSGKTVVSFLAMLAMAENGYKALLMAPTEVLAEQHYRTFSDLLQMLSLPFEAVLLTGAVTGKNRKEVLEKIAQSGGIFIIGTSALISEAREYGNIGIVVTDEQHRFGVKQRFSLIDKGNDKVPYTLVMSATPIPRTLAMILYQDMRISVIKERPKNRLPIKNCIIRPEKRPVAYNFIKKEIDAGHQAYVICPFVEQSEDDSSIADVISYSESLKRLFPKDITIGLLHGRMKDDEKNAVMADFAENRINILVSTTVIEVGIDVKNATVILIENADRFGMAQLHQLRGRIGRGEEQSYCIFMDCSGKDEAPERLSAVNSSNDGFFIAEQDLTLRGPGDLTGIRQSGDISFEVADPVRDAGLMKAASSDARALLADDPSLSENPSVAERLKELSGKFYRNL